jgi:diacylglycerol kinase (ATP)
MLKEAIKKRIRSFKYAFQGVFYLFRTEGNAKIHLAAACLAVLLGFLFSITPGEWCLIILSIFSTISAEAFNTAIEDLVDLVSPEKHPLAGRAKDLAAGAVLLTAMGAAAVGVVIFLPRILDLLFSY